MIIKIVCLGICVSILSVILSEYQKSFVLPVQIVFASIIIAMIYGEAKDSVDSILSLFNFEDVTNKILICLLKGALICVSTKLAEDFCKESGNTFVASIIELAGRIMLLVIALPFCESIIKTALSFVK